MNAARVLASARTYCQVDVALWKKACARMALLSSLKLLKGTSAETC